MTFDELANEFTLYYSNFVKENTMYGHCEKIRIINQKIGRMDVENIDFLILQRSINQICKERNLSIETIKK